MDIMGKRLWFFVIAGVLVLICIISLADDWFKDRSGIQQWFDINDRFRTNR